MTAGSLGDYLKRHAGMAYASWNNIIRNSTNFNNEDDDNIQWEEPLGSTAMNTGSISITIGIWAFQSQL